MTLDQIDQIVRAANPVPDPRALESDASVPLSSAAVVANLEPARDDETRRHSRLVAAAAVAVAVVLVAGSVLLANRDDHATQLKPATPRSSTTTHPPPSSTAPLLPEGAPSAPSTGELVAAINIRHRGVYRLYADGRLIQVWTLLEQRLTPEGVERVRSRFLSSGLFDAAQPVAEIDGFCAISACVRDGDHWLQVEVDVGGPSGSQAPPNAVQLFSDLESLDSWLPATAVVDAQAKPHVPGRIGTCVGMYVDGAPAAFDLSVLLSRLPEPAAAVLETHERSSEMEGLLVPLTRFDAGVSSPIVAPHSGCFDLTLDEARTLVDTLFTTADGGTNLEGNEVSFGQQPDPSQSGATRNAAARVWVFQLLPDAWPIDAFGD